ncbi:TetR/AcrR family transcriptional regulator [Pseudomonas sp. NA-150]|uniref:TetR/AcrR family transcriptional regulator n=1 Tax=Pseudomonas sp. NA-150 TaxID=3367525 RepID=UPI0037C91DDF
MELDGRKFRRAEPDERRELLISAALKCLAEEGHAGISVRRIAKEAGVSVGLVNHHFGSIDVLIADAYQKLSLGMTNALQLEVDQAGNAAERMDAFLVGSFSPRVLDPSLLSVWVVFWSLVRHSPHVSNAHEQGYGAYRNLLERLLNELADEENFQINNASLAAIGLSAMLDGLWLEWCLNPTTFGADDALDICRRWVNGLRRGAFGGNDNP